MKKNRGRYIAFAINFLSIVLLFVLRYSGLLTLKIGQASPILLIPFIIAVAIFYGEWYGTAAGFFSGALMDSSMIASSCFNTITLMLIGLIAGLLASRFLNKNIRSAACLSLGAAFIYLITKQTFFYSFKEITIGADYYGLYFIPTVIYTALFIVPFYFLEKRLKNL